MHTPTLMLTVLLASLTGAAQAADAMQIDLRRGHFVIEADDTVETLRVDMVEQPGGCRQVLVATTIDSLRVDLRPAIADCNRDPYAIVRINPRWQNAVDLNLGAGQINVAGSMMGAVATLDATVSAGDIFGVPGVERRWLVGAHVHVDRQRPGLDLAMRVGGGQISLASEVASPH